MPLGRVGFATPCVARRCLDFFEAVGIFRAVAVFPSSALILAIVIVAGAKRKAQFKTAPLEGDIWLFVTKQVVETYNTAVGRHFCAIDGRSDRILKEQRTDCKEV